MTEIMDIVDRIVELENQRVELQKLTIELATSTRSRVTKVAHGQIACLSFVPQTTKGRERAKKAYEYLKQEYSTESSSEITLPGM